MIPRANGIGAFIGLIAGMVSVAAVNFGAPKVSFLWHNVVGAVAVVVVGVLISLVTGGARTPRTSEPTIAT
jgi:Na+/proline symporter